MRLPSLARPAPRRAAGAARPHRPDRHRLPARDHRRSPRCPACSTRPTARWSRSTASRSAVGADRPVVHRQGRQPARAVLPVPPVGGRRRLRPDRDERVEPRPGERRRHPAATRPGQRSGRRRHAAACSPRSAPAASRSASSKASTAPGRTAPPTASARCSAVFYRDGAHRPDHPGGQPQPGLPGHPVHRDLPGRRGAVRDVRRRLHQAASSRRSAATPRPHPAVPADAVTASGSGLDPDISPAYAELQAPGSPRPAASTSPRVDGSDRAVHHRPGARLHGRARRSTCWS